MAVIQAPEDGIVRISRRDTEPLPGLAQDSGKGRARICAHRNSENLLHEMLIWLTPDTYVRPHRHVGKSESFHVIRGSLRVVIFDDTGAPIERIDMGAYESGKVFFYRLEEPLFHTVIPDPPGALIHEVTNGPFVPADAEFAEWAPDETDEVQSQQYMATLRGRIIGETSVKDQSG